ncbi:Glutaredoxin [Salipaludibacillus aurantiacus]|uniref:Glutaredoxin n=2 Tax=Salipaludibacillus aurantiacus TaxID=1601833 RepID=A0A1H9UCP1_9BACI|nr:Glutaredoxin [Salipaludibacillus aurantiacus]
MAKEFLSKNKVSYEEHDVSKNPKKEQRLIKLTGSKMVPALLFKEKSFVGFLKKPEILIGFEANKERIQELVK